MKIRLLPSRTFQKAIFSALAIISVFEVCAQSDTSSVSNTKLKDSSIVVTNGVKLEQLSANFKGLNQLPLKSVSSQPYISLQQLLKGNVAGVYVQEPSGEPGTEQNLFIRGISSPLLSKRELFDQQAVIFLNGIPLIQDNPFAYEIQRYDFNRIGPATNLLSTINPDNIESIEVIKDPLTLATLGPIAANGAIWITTKNAHSGYRDISVNSYYGYALKPNVTPVNAAYENNFRAPFYDKYASISDRLNYPPYLRDSTNADYYGPANWGDLYYKNAPLYNMDLSLTGGSDRANFRFFGGATKNANIADNTSLSRYTGSFFINAAPLKWLTVSSMINYNRLQRVRNRNVRDRLAEQRYIPDLTNPLTPNKNLYGSYLSEFDKAIDNNANNAIQGYLAVSADLNKFHYNGRLAFDYNEGIRDAFWPTTLLEGNNFVSNYSSYNQRAIGSNTIGYDVRFGGKNKLNFEAGQSFMGDIYKYDYAYAYNGPNDFVKINVVDPASLKPTSFMVYYYPAKMRSALISFSGKATYSFDDIFNINAVVRRDGSSNMQPDNRWMTNYSVGADWDIKKHLLSSCSVTDALSLSASWGRLGKLLSDDRFNAGAQYRVDLGWGSEPGLGSYNGIAGISRPYTSGWVGYGIPWAYSDQMNVGVRLGLLNNRVRVAADVYNRDDKDQLLPIPVASEWGYTGAYQSGMSVNNKGVDLFITAELVAAKNHAISWVGNLNMNYNTNKLTALPGGLNELVIGNNKLVVGKRIDAFWLLDNLGDYKSDAEIPVDPLKGRRISYQGTPIQVGDARWRDINGDYVINDNDKTLQGNYLPKVSGGFGSTLGYKAFSLDVQFYVALGRKVLNQYASSRLDFINTDANNDINSIKEITFWEQKMDLSSYPVYNPWSSVVPYRVDQNLFLDDASFLKLRSLSLSYDFAKSMSKHKSFRKLELYLSATNLFTITPFKGDDPELVNYNGIYTGYGLPMSPSVITGVKLNL
ncbi:SusC/RagA family TonB-linked outer membrane protein [Chitinophagaceae bacterium LB-8]|uniref:SusC/RagA family TonB-linked outer membrane protein n=1 Tax=Paraflavisolibacter caeni TaxID=2982496 RepID=A0A9X2XNR4_9BACT|nr:SusC/RagA family TonB-linked outer membrane protein [Paraflavisolibacter caeni]MCU7549418.1 SusC/RagA family TonB-linked outer membrane protein [Paraflavisolibacter caeni]